MMFNANMPPIWIVTNKRSIRMGNKPFLRNFHQKFKDDFQKTYEYFLGQSEITL